MSTDHANEAAEMIDEIEADALQNDEPLTIDQRIAVASIRASLAATELANRQVESMREQTDALRINGENAARMVELMTPPPAADGQTDAEPITTDPRVTARETTEPEETL